MKIISGDFIDNSEVMTEFYKLAFKSDKDDEHAASIIDEAHPEPIYIADALGDGGLVENQNEQSERIKDIVNKMPNGSLVHRYASCFNELIDLSKDMETHGDVDGSDFALRLASGVLDSIPFVVAQESSLKKEALLAPIGKLVMFVGKNIAKAIGAIPDAARSVKSIVTDESGLKAGFKSWYNGYRVSENKLSLITAIQTGNSNTILDALDNLSSVDKIKISEIIKPKISSHVSSQANQLAKSRSAMTKEIGGLESELKKQQTTFSKIRIPKEFMGESNDVLLSDVEIKRRAEQLFGEEIARINDAYKNADGGVTKDIVMTHLKEKFGSINIDNYVEKIKNLFEDRSEIAQSIGKLQSNIDISKEKLGKVTRYIEQVNKFNDEINRGNIRRGIEELDKVDFELKALENAQYEHSLITELPKLELAKDKVVGLLVADKDSIASKILLSDYANISGGMVSIKDPDAFVKELARTKLMSPGTYNLWLNENQPLLNNIMDSTNKRLGLKVREILSADEKTLLSIAGLRPADLALNVGLGAGAVGSAAIAINTINWFSSSSLQGLDPVIGKCIDDIQKLQKTIVNTDANNLLGQAIEHLRLIKDKMIWIKNNFAQDPEKAINELIPVLEANNGVGTVIELWENSITRNSSNQKFSQSVLGEVLQIYKSIAQDANKLVSLLSEAQI